MSTNIAGTGKDYLDYAVITTKGVKSITDINIGDYVYEFNTGRKVMVTGVEKTEPEIVYHIIYTDGRSQMFLGNQFIYTGQKIEFLPDEKETKEITFSSLNPKRIEFDQYPVIEGLDPYTFGMLYMFGNFYDSYVNLPISVGQASRLLLDKYTFINVGEIGYDYCYFRYNNSDQNIKWTDLFEIGSQEDVISAMRSIPDKYIYTSAKNRIQFVTGVFDFGVDLDMSYRKNISIINNDSLRLNELQRILWSLGIISITNYSVPIHNFLGIDYMMTVLPSLENNGYPKFFYNIDKINRFIMESNALDNVQIKNFETLPKLFTKFGTKKKWSYQLHLEEPKVVFLTKNFLPMVSA